MGVCTKTYVISKEFNEDYFKVVPKFYDFLKEKRITNATNIYNKKYLTPIELKIDKSAIYGYYRIELDGKQRDIFIHQPTCKDNFYPLDDLDDTYQITFSLGCDEQAQIFLHELAVYMKKEFPKLTVLFLSNDCTDEIEIMK